MFNQREIDNVKDNITDNLVKAVEMYDGAGNDSLIDICVELMYATEAVETFLRYPSMN